MASRLFEIKKNQLQMVRRRGYSIEREQNLLQITAEEFEEAYIPFAEQQKKSLRTVLSQLYEKENGEKLYVYYADAPADKSQLGVDIIGDAIQEMDRFKSKNGIIITSKQLSSSARKQIEGLVSYNVSIFMEDEMLYDPTAHYLTPEHIGLTPDVQRDLLKRNKINLDQLPIILTSDMIARYYGFKVGQVIQINRVNLYETIVPHSVAYRVVKEDIS